MRIKLVGTALLCALNAALLVAVVAFLGQRHTIYALGQRTITSDVNAPFYVAHPLLGYKTASGSRTITLRDGDRLLAFSTATGPDGYRLTSFAPQQQDGRPEIWIFGCSYTWGWLLDTQDSFPFRLQSALPQYAVRNFGIPGYGTVHAAVQLRTELASSSAEYAILAYASFHKRRNVAASSRMLECKNFEMYGKLRHPQATLDDTGRPAIRLVPITAADDADDPPAAVMDAVTIALLADIHDGLLKKGIVPILAVLNNENDDPVVRRARAMGYDVLDINLDNTEPRYHFPALDSHPNAEANKAYAAAILRHLAGREHP